MFERYNERARRAVFFARYEASQSGSVAIQTGHLFLGLLREGRELRERFFPGATTAEEVRRTILKGFPDDGKTPESVDLPLSHDCKRALSYAAAEAGLGTDAIGPEHLLCGILRVDGVVTDALREVGVTLSAVRNSLSENPMERAEPDRVPEVPSGTSHPNYVPDAETAVQIARAVFIPIVGEDAVDGQEPFEARLEHGHWRVLGSGWTDKSEALLAIVGRTGHVVFAGRGEPFAGGAAS